MDFSGCCVENRQWQIKERSRENIKLSANGRSDQNASTRSHEKW